MDFCIVLCFLLMLFDDGYFIGVKGVIVDVRLYENVW